MVVEEFHDQKIIYHLNIDEEVNNILMHLSSLKTIKTNRVIKGTTLVGAFYIFSLAFYSYLFHILFAWIFLLLSIGFAAIGLSVEKLQKVFMRAIINKEKQKMNNERKYVFSKEGVDIVTQAGATHERKAREVEQKYRITSKQYVEGGLQLRVISEIQPELECMSIPATLEDAYIYVTNQYE